MKVVQIVTQMEAGGAQRVAHMLTNSLRDRGYEAELWFLYKKRPTYSDMAGVRSLFDHRPSSLDYVRILYRLLRSLCNSKPDVVITHTHYSNLMGQISAFVCGVRRRIAVQHNPVETYPAVARIGDRLLGSIGVYSQNVAVSHAVITSIGQYSAGYRHRTQVIHNAVSVTPTGHIRNDVRARWMIPAASPLLVNVGRLSWQKNQKFLLRLLPRLPGVHLAVIGEGEMKEELIRLAEELSVAERVHFIGEVRPEEANAVVCASDVFVFPSLFEAMPLALLEAMALGVPIVCSDIPSSREFLGSNGILAKLNDPAEWTSAIQMMLDGKGSVSMMVRMALARSAEFTVEKMADGYEALFTTDAPQELSDVVSAERAR